MAISGISNHYPGENHMVNPVEEIETGLEALSARLHEFTNCSDENELITIRATLFGKNGELNRLLKLMGDVSSSDHRQSIGEKVNTIRAKAKEVFDIQLKTIRSAGIKEPPRVKINHIEDVEGPAFLTLIHQKIQLQYPNGTKSEEFVHDVVTRDKLDAVVIVAFDISNVQTAGEVNVWLRSCVRPAVASRHPYPNALGNGWELPAGLVDQGEMPEQTAVRELREEVGFEVNEVTELGRPVWGSVGIAPERIFFYATDVTGLKRKTPSEDGSPLERYGDCVLAPLSHALQVGDMKTDLGILRLKNMFEPFDRMRLIHQVLGSLEEDPKKIEELAKKMGIQLPENG